MMQSDTRQSRRVALIINSINLRVIQEHTRRAKFDFQPQVASLTPNMGLTETEMKIVAPLVEQAEKCRVSCEQFEKMITSLETQKDEKLAQVNEWFENAHTVLNQSHSHTTEEIKAKHAEVHSVLSRHLEATRKTQQEIKPRRTTKNQRVKKQIEVWL